MKGKLNLISWNVKGLNHQVKRGKVFTHLKQLRAEIVFLQETHLLDSDQWHLGKCQRGKLFHSSFGGRARGTAILIDSNIPFESSNTISDNNGRFIIVSGKLYNRSVTLANVYAPNFDTQFCKRFFSQLPDLNSHSLFLGGILIVIQTQYWTALPLTLPLLVELLIISNNFLLIIASLIHTGFLYPTGTEYSFFSHVHHTYTRIDHFFC